MTRDVLTDYAGLHADGNLDLVKRTLLDDPSNVVLRDWYALNLYQAQRYEDARRQYEALIALDGANPDQHYYLGNCCLALGDVAAALASWQRVIELDPRGRRGVKALQKLSMLAAGQD